MLQRQQKLGMSTPDLGGCASLTGQLQTQSRYRG